MSDQYYYLLDGKEHGPFSPAAIEALQSSSSMSGALYRQGTDPVWRTLDEIGLVKNVQAETVEVPVESKVSFDKYGFPIQRQNLDPAELVFKSTKHKRNSAGLGAWSYLGFLAIAIAAVTLFIKFSSNSDLRQMRASSSQAELATEGNHRSNVDSRASAFEKTRYRARGNESRACIAFTEFNLGPRPGINDHPNCKQYWNDIMRMCRSAEMGDHHARMVVPKMAGSLSRMYSTLQCGVW